MNVLLVTTWGTACGIAEHSAMLMDAVRATGVSGPDDRYSVSPEALDPAAVFPLSPMLDILHLNYHAALHSRWTPEAIRRAQNFWGCKVLVTYHDTGVPNSDQCKSICAAADYFVVHEPYDDLPSHGEYLRMGVPSLSSSLFVVPYNRREGSWNLAYPDQPVLGTIGFPFPWKNYDELAKVTAACGWAFYVIAPNATDEDLYRWMTLNPYTTVRREFLPRTTAIRLLHDCDATAFTYVCHNTGQSGAILQGIAARKPVIALQTCRQFRSLWENRLGQDTITWAESFDDVARHLRTLLIQRVDPGIVALAEQESWTKVGKRYAEIYRSLVSR